MIWIGFDFWPGWPSFELFLWSMLLLGVAHVCLHFTVGKRVGETGIFFMLHTLANAAICYRALPDTLHILAYPWDALTDTPRTCHAIVIAIHLHHVLFFKLSRDDRNHHLVSVGFVGGIAYLFRFGRIVHAVNFFICGLPGGMDYFLLSLVKLGVIPKITEKRWNLWLQCAIRYPGITICLYAAIVSKLHFGDELSVGWIPVLTVLVLHGGNGLYYAQRVCGDTYLAEKAIKDAKKAEEGKGSRSEPG